MNVESIKYVESAIKVHNEPLHQSLSFKWEKYAL